jgi:DnaJ-domain-containing protein 1
MTWILIGGFGLLAAIWIVQYVRGIDRLSLMRSLRWIAGGVAVLGAVLAVLFRRFEIVALLGVTAFSIFRNGRIGAFSFDSFAGPGSANVSKIRSRFLAMELDHDTGSLDGRVLDGRFAGADLLDLDEAQTRNLIDEIGGDADSVNLLESWLDTNRAGWREYFAGQDGANGQGAGSSGGESSRSADPVAEAYAVLGLKAGASDQDIRKAHRDLMKGVHPDRGGSEFLAARINEARDLLLGR